MDYLLDTHAVIWFITNDPKLTETAKRQIENIDNKCFVSIASYWEIGIKSSLGRLEMDGSLENIFQIIGQSGLDVLPITQGHILHSATLKFHHNDPFDRLIIAQGVTENLTLISKDRIFKNYDVPIFW